LAWGAYKQTGIPHLIDQKQNMPALSRLNLNVGGGEGIVNATKQSQAFKLENDCIYDFAGRSLAYIPRSIRSSVANQYYDTGVTTWAPGSYFKLWLMKATESNSAKVKQTIVFNLILLP
jgi:penicillin amidase